MIKSSVYTTGNTKLITVKSYKLLEFDEHYRESKKYGVQLNKK